MIMVSCYCLAYNSEKYIRQTLEGFVKQKTDFNFEVIVNDDASTDKTAEIIREYTEKYPNIIKPVFQKENMYTKGINMFMTIIYPRVRGKYIAICEGDDYWNDEYKLQKQYDALEQHPECSMSTHKVQCCNEDGTPNSRIIPDPFYQIEAGVVDEKKLVDCLWGRGTYPFHTSSYFFRTAVVEDCINIYNFEIGRDMRILRACLLKGLTFYFDDAMSTRRLWSIGNWNSRLRDSGIEGKINYQNSTCETELEFDKISEYKYHELIMTAIFKRIISWAPYRPEEAKEKFKTYNLTYSKIKKNLCLKNKIIFGIKYFLVMYFPKCFQMVIKIVKRKNR